MKCKSCGREIVDNSIFCNWCGRRQVKEKSQDISVPTPVKLKSGNWRIYLRAEQQSITEATPELCTAKAMSVRAGFIKQKEKLPHMTVGAAIDKYIKDHTKVLSPSTVQGYKSIRKHRFTAIMDKPIDSGIEWQAAIGSEALEYGAKSLKNAWALIASSLKYAGVSVPNVKLPTVMPKTRAWLDYKQIKAFQEAICGSDAELAALLALSSLRRSEVCALRKSDINLKDETIHVHAAKVDSSDGFTVKESTKNASSTRTVPIMIPRLKELLAQCNEDYIVALHPHTLAYRINSVCRKAGLPEVGMHGLRHSFASLCYHLNVSEMECQQYGGWSTPSTMRKIYTHLAMADKAKTSKKLKAFYK